MSHLRTVLSNSPASTFAVLDAAALDGLLEPLYQLAPDAFSCLLIGELEPDVAHVAPYLVRLHPESALVDWLEQKLDLPWGYLVESPLSASELHLHLRKFSEVRAMNGEVLFFRFWDPRVMSCVAQIFTAQQSESFMQGITRIRVIAPGSNSIANFHWNKQSQKLECFDETLTLMEDWRRVAV